MNTYQVYNNPHTDTPIKAWTRGVPISAKAIEQLRNTASLPFIFRHVAAMPDVHWGTGATIGSVIATEGAVIPAAVGVDIGCGMMATPLTLNASDLPDSLKALREAIENAVPLGKKVHQHVAKEVHAEWERRFDAEYRWILERHGAIEPRRTHPAQMLASLGGGNHFIELCLDERDTVWIMLHSGSRGIGNRIGTHFIGAAREEMRRYHIKLADKDLAYLPAGTSLHDDYLRAMRWAQSFAQSNRELLMALTLQAVAAHLPPFEIRPGVINCHHNYAEMEHHFNRNVLVTRKGALRARRGDWGIIPGSMGTCSFIVQGKGNPESFMSCSHGAGRLMSRSAAKQRFTSEEHRKATAAVECRKDKAVLDETPGAYKNLADVMAAQSDLVKPVHTLRQLVCVKG